MAQIPEDVKNQILAARQSYATSFQTVNKPILEYSGAVQRAGAGSSFLGSYGQIQQAVGQQQKAKQEITAQSQEFEKQIAQQVPELGSPEIVQKEYQVALAKVNEKIQEYQSKIDRAQQRIEQIKQSNDKRKSERIDQYEEDIEDYEVRQRAWKEYAGKGKEDVIRGYTTGAISDLQSYYEDKNKQSEQRREQWLANQANIKKYVEENKTIVDEVLKTTPNAVVYYDTYNAPHILGGQYGVIIPKENVMQIPFLSQKIESGQKLTVDDVNYASYQSSVFQKALTIGQAKGQDVQTIVTELKKTNPSVVTNLGLDKIDVPKVETAQTQNIPISTYGRDTGYSFGIYGGPQQTNVTIDQAVQSTMDYYKSIGREFTGETPKSNVITLNVPTTQTTFGGGSFGGAGGNIPTGTVRPEDILASQKKQAEGEGITNIISGLAKASAEVQNRQIESQAKALGAIVEGVKKGAEIAAPVVVGVAGEIARPFLTVAGLTTTGIEKAAPYVEKGVIAAAPTVFAPFIGAAEAGIAGIQFIGKVKEGENILRRELGSLALKGVKATIPVIEKGVITIAPTIFSPFISAGELGLKVAGITGKILETEAKREFTKGQEELKKDIALAKLGWNYVGEPLLNYNLAMLGLSTGTGIATVGTAGKILETEAKREFTKGQEELKKDIALTKLGWNYVGEPLLNYNLAMLGLSTGTGIATVETAGKGISTAIPYIEKGVIKAAPYVFKPFSPFIGAAAVTGKAGYDYIIKPELEQQVKSFKKQVEILKAIDKGAYNLFDKTFYDWSGRHFKGTAGDYTLAATMGLFPIAYAGSNAYKKILETIGEKEAGAYQKNPYTGEYYRISPPNNFFGQVIGREMEVKTATPEELEKIKKSPEAAVESALEIGSSFYKPLAGALAALYAPQFLIKATAPKEEGGGIIPAAKEYGIPLSTAAVTGLTNYLRIPGKEVVKDILSGQLGLAAESYMLRPQIWGQAARTFIAFSNSPAGQSSFQRTSEWARNQIQTEQQILYDNPKLSSVKNKVQEDFNQKYADDINKNKITFEQAKKEFMESNVYKDDVANLEKEKIKGESWGVGAKIFGLQILDMVTPENPAQTFLLASAPAIWKAIPTWPRIGAEIYFATTELPKLFKPELSKEERIAGGAFGTLSLFGAYQDFTTNTILGREAKIFVERSLAKVPGLGNAFGFRDIRAESNVRLPTKKFDEYKEGMWDPASKQRAAVIPTDGEKVIVAINRADGQYLLPGGSPEVGRTFSLGADSSPLRTAAREYLEESYRGFKNLKTSEKLNLITTLEKQLQFKGVEITGDVTTYIYGLPVDDVAKYLKTLTPSSDVSSFKSVSLDTLTFKEPTQLSPTSQPTNLFNKIFRPMSGYREDTSWILNKYFKNIPDIDNTLNTMSKVEKTELLNEATAWFKSSESPYKSKWYSIKDFTNKEIVQEYILNQQGLSGFPVHTWGGTKQITDMYYNPQVKGWQFVSRDQNTGKILEQAAKWQNFKIKGIDFDPGYYEMTYGVKGVQIKPLDLNQQSIFSPPKQGDLGRLTFSVSSVDPKNVHVEWVQSSQSGSGRVMMDYLKSISQGKTLTLTDATIGGVTGIQNYDITGKRIVFDLDNTLVGRNGQIRPNVIELLDKLKKNDNELILWTHSTSDRTANILQKNGLGKYFNKVITREDYENPLLGENTLKNIKSIGADLLIDNRQSNIDSVIKSGGEALKISTYKTGGSQAFNNLWNQIGEKIGTPIVKGKLGDYYGQLGYTNIAGTNEYKLIVPSTFRAPNVPIMVGITGGSRYDVPFDTVQKYQATYQPIGHATPKSPTALFGWGEFETSPAKRGGYFYTQPPYVSGGKLSPEFIGIHYLDIGKSAEYPTLGFATGQKAYIQFEQPIGLLGQSTAPVTTFTGTPKDIPRGAARLIKEFEYGTGPESTIQYVSGKGIFSLTFGKGQEMINVAGYPVGLPYARVVPSAAAQEESAVQKTLELFGGEKIVPSLAGPALITIPAAGLLGVASELITKPSTIAPTITYSPLSITTETTITGGTESGGGGEGGGGGGGYSGGGGKKEIPSIPEIPKIPEIPITPEIPKIPEIPRQPETPRPFEISRPYETNLPGLLPPSKTYDIITKPEKKKIKKISGYQLEVRRRRKFRVESPFALPKEEALTLGIRRTLGSAAATFRLVPTEESAKSLGLPAPSGKSLSYFRAPKTKVPQPLTFVQKERMRITSPGEKREITYAGIRASASRIKSPKPKATTFKKIRNKSFLGSTKRRNVKFI
jgi:hypothetical protein